MKRLRVLSVVVCLAISRLSATNYYVDAGAGNDTYNGTAQNFVSGTTGPWKTLAHAAAATLSPGDIVYVKAGDYTNENVIVASSGTAGNPITFKGYYSSPTDQPAILAPTATATTVFSSKTMPLFTGTSRNSGEAFNCQNRKYITFKNFQIQNYEYGFLAGGSAASNSGNIVLDNINIKSIGNITGGYSGNGFLFGSIGSAVSNNNTITNCLVINSAAEGFGISGSYNTLTGCKVFCNEGTSDAPTDFYINICGSNNTISSCYVECAEGITGLAYGMGTRTDAIITAQNNTFTDCVAKNIYGSFYVHHRTSTLNTFTRCKSYGTHLGNYLNAPSKEGGCIEIRDGASSNTFNSCTAENCAVGIRFEDSSEDGDSGTPPAPGHPGNSNKILNSIFNNCYVGVTYVGDNSFTVNDAGDNTIGNCTFYKTRYIHFAESSHCTKMKYIGNIYYGCLPTAYGGKFIDGNYITGSSGPKYSDDIVSNGVNTYFKQCDYYQIEGSMPAGYIGVNSSIGTDPQFVDAASKNFHLKSTSPCVDIVNALTNAADFDARTRPNGTKAEIGAFEYYLTKIYYVDKAGSNTNTGLSKTVGGSGGPWATLTYAASASVLQPGDIVYVKADSFPNEHVVFTKSGTEGNPISFIGYTSGTNPGDPVTPLVGTATANTKFITTFMPTYVGATRNSTTGFDAANQKYLVIKNFQIRNYDTGIKLGGTSQTAGNNVLDNVNVMTLGDPSGYGGRGILLGSMGTDFSNNNTISNCLVIDAAAEGISISGNYNTVNNCKVFSKESAPASSDYYIMVCGSYNKVSSCTVNRKTGMIPKLEGAHGIGAKTNAEQVVDGTYKYPPIPAQYNTFTNCTAINLGEGFYVRHRTAQYNLFSHCFAKGTHIPGGAEGEGNGIEIRDGASDNTFDGFVVDSCARGVIIEESVEDGDTGSPGPGHPGNNNKIVNSIFKRSYCGVYFQGINTVTVNDAGDNTIANNTFYRTEYMNWAGSSHCTKMKYVGNIYYGNADIPYAGQFITGNYITGSSGPKYSDDFQANGTNTYFKQNDMNNIGGTTIPAAYFVAMPTGPGNISSAPGFVSSTDLHLASTSACINKVDVITYDFNKIDFDGYKRRYPTNSEMGAYEYNSILPPPAPLAITDVIDEKEIVIYPNPSSGLINIASSLDASYVIKVYNVMGQSVYGANYTSTVDLGNLNSGMYFIQILSAEGKPVLNKKIYID